jgi:DNA polymerase eta
MEITSSHDGVGYESARSKQATFPFTKNVTVDVVAAAGNKLWDELVGKTTFSVNNISLAFTGIEVSEVGQQSIAGFLRTSSKPSSSGTPTPLKRPVPEDDENTHKYHCPECGEMLSVPEELELEESERQALITQMRLEHTDGHFAQRLAKEDEPNDRFAKSTLSGSGNQKPSRKRQKANGKKNGIRQFFQPV